MFQSLEQLEKIRTNESLLLKSSSPLDTLILTELFRSAPSPLMTKTLINVTGHERRAVRKSIDYLLRQGLIDRVENPIDKRAKFYTLSMKGMRAFRGFLESINS
jgi:DNA-binding MarR family transcriptional regulator